MRRMRRQAEIESDRDGECPHCASERLCATPVRLEPWVCDHEFLRCQNCGYIHSQPILGDGTPTRPIHPHDIQLIRGYLDRVKELNGYDLTKRCFQKETLLRLARFVDGPLHEATRDDIKQPLNRPGRPFDLFLLYVNGREKALESCINRLLDPQKTTSPSQHHPEE